MLLSRAVRAQAAEPARACAKDNGRNDAGCFEACVLGTGAVRAPSDSFVAKLRTLSAAGHHVRGSASPAPVSRFRVASIPFGKEAAGRWRQNGLWAGPCAGLTAAFHATAAEDKDPRKLVELYELRYGSELAARRVGALLASSWRWNGHPFVAVQQGSSVLVAEGRYGAWGALEAVGAHLAGTIPAAGGPPALALCDKGAPRRPIFQGDGVAVHVLGFAASGQLAWLDASAAQSGETVWTLHVTNLVDDRELVARTYRTAAPGADAFCAQHRADAGQVLADQAVSGAAFTGFDKAASDGEPLEVVLRRDPSGRTEIVMQGAPGTKVLGRLPASIASARALGFIRSPFEERVAVLVLARGGPMVPTGRAAVRVFGGRLDKRWIPRALPAQLASTASPAAR
ncbi:MAG TPA: hypothetical protein VHO67_17840 [Polyangia bacterium]|nr:hypothetical protein [Polyangia bacterium]